MKGDVGPGLRLRSHGALRRAAEASRSVTAYQVPYVAVRTDGQTRRRATVRHRGPGRRPQRPPPSRRPSRGAWSPATRSRSACPGAGSTPTATRSPSPASRRHPAWAGSSPSAATSSSTRPIRAPSGPTSSSTPWSTPRARSPPALVAGRRRAARAAAAAARRRRPAHGRAGADGHLRPVGQRLRRARRRRTDRARRRSRQVPRSTRRPTW